APVATPAAPPPAFEQNTLKIEHLKLEGPGDWQSWFGAPTTRDLVFTVHNTGGAPVDDPPLVLTAGKGNNPERVVTPPSIGRIEAGTRRTVRAEIPLDPLSFGSYTVKGRIGTTGAEKTFRTHFSIYPWGLFVVGIVILQLMLLGLRNGLRRRIAAREARKAAATELEPVPEAAGWEQERTDDEWSENHYWTEDYESTADDDYATADTDFVPAE